ncbi:MAG: DUF4270 domain-containing protein [Prevotellaceae bacterium]|jgi:hypothetical protein|nr:DUF4270 domain-containing protein [Prevotellaceae bacterium]
MRLKFVFVTLLPILLLSACKDTDQVGSSIQPDEDLLQVHSNKIYVESASVLMDSVLSKSSDLFLGKYTDAVFGQTQAEFISQIDARLGVNGLTIPDTTIVSSNSTYSGIPSDFLSKKDPAYGPVKEITLPENENVRADSVFFVIGFTDVFGDTTMMSSAQQGIKIYALNKTLESSAVHKYYTNTDIADFCKMDTLLGEGTYNVRENKDGIVIRLESTDGKQLGDRLINVYRKGSTINTQSQFNDFFKGIYVSSYFNESHIMKIYTAYLLVYYSFDANVSTTYQGRDTTINRRLPNYISLSANKAVERVNLFRHVDLVEKFPSLQNNKTTYTYTPAGMYTAVNIPFTTMVDSIENKPADTAKVMFNSVRLTFFAKKLDWKTDLNKTPNPYMLLIHKDSIVPFFHRNKIPDGASSFFAAYNKAGESYTFDLTKAAQRKLTGQNFFTDNLVVIPVVVEEIDNRNYYRQQLWLTAAMLHGKEAEESKRPRLDMVYTERK